MYTLYARIVKKKRITDQFQIITIRTIYAHIRIHGTPGVREN